MVINASNGEIINSRDVYIHDDILEDFYFDRIAKKLCLTFSTDRNSGRERFSMTFLHVIGFEMTACDFWGPSPHVLDFEYVGRNNSSIISKLFKKKSQNSFPYCSLTNQENYIETVITFTSGDKLIIACESIII